MPIGARKHHNPNLRWSKEIQLATQPGVKTAGPFSESPCPLSSVLSPVFRRAACGEYDT